jgi:LDH2 family malate/lactate/ureidoglycolate dehydrogenase
MRISLAELEQTTTKAIQSYGFNEKETERIREVLLYAQLRGNNQGVVKLIGQGIPKREGNKAPEIVKETPVSALVDGNRTHAIVVMDYLTDLAIKKAKASHVGIAGNFNTDESTGALGYYTNRIATQGLIGFAFASAPYQTTAPHGSNQARFCTNPLSCSFPTSTDPVNLDMSTSVMAYYGLIEAKTAGRQVPSDIGFDAEGKPTTDPAQIMAGALRTIAGHKGSGLAFMVQVLAGTFVRADSFDNDSDNSGNLVMAIDPEIFMNLNEFRSNVSELVSKVKSARKADGVEEILLPGESGNKLTKRHLESGEVEIEDNLWQELKKVAKNL